MNGLTWGKLCWRYSLKLILKWRSFNTLERRQDPMKLYLSYINKICLGSFDGASIPVSMGYFLNSDEISLFLKDLISYSRDNSTIFLESSYWKKSLWPRCWLWVTLRCRGFMWWVCSTFKPQHELSLERRELVQFLSSN